MRWKAVIGLACILTGCAGTGVVETGHANGSGSSIPVPATPLSLYKEKVRRAVGARWYKVVDQQFATMPVGKVHIQFTINQDGSVVMKVLAGNELRLRPLLIISQNAMLQAAPFERFSPALIKQIGSSYTDDYTFTIYGLGNPAPAAPP